MSPAAVLGKTAGWLLGVLVRTDTTLTEFFSSALLYAWALYFVLPFAAPRSDAMQDLIAITARYGGRWAIAGLCLVVAVTQTAANLARHRRWRRKVAFAASLLYGFLCALCSYDLPGAIFNYTTAVCSFVSAVVYLRLSLPLPRPWADPE